jgi:hypothetical protein
MRTIVLTAIAVLSCLLPDTGNAAQMSAGPRSLGCDWTISGPINVGDTSLLVPNHPSWGNTICLDSDGGNVSEAFLMMDRIQQNSLWTKVPAGARCLSAWRVPIYGGHWRR